MVRGGPAQGFAIVVSRTRELWDKQNEPVGDRHRLFASVAKAIQASHVLYPGSYVDLAAAFVWPHVTFIDEDRRANSFFTDTEGIRELLREQGIASENRSIRFIHGDYCEPLGLEEDSFDLLLSLYAGFISEHCTQYLRIGGHLLVTPSHGDAAMASIDPRYRLSSVVAAGNGGYQVISDGLSSYLVPKRDVVITKEFLHQSGRGVAYSRSPFAYVFERYR